MTPHAHERRGPSAILIAVLLAATAFLALPAGRAFAEEPVQPGEQQRQQEQQDAEGGDAPPSVDGPQVQVAPKEQKKADVAPDAAPVVEKVRDGYKALTSVSLAGTLTGDFDVDGRQQKNDASFTATFEAPNKFRHEAKDDLLVGSTGEKAYAYRPESNLFVMADAPKQRVTARELPSPIGQLLDQQNPSLLLALAPDAGVQLVDGVVKVEKAADEKIGDTTYTALKLTASGGEQATVLVHPQTGLLRRVVIDLSKPMLARGQDVKRALVTIDYTDVQPGAKVAAEQFAWAPPEGARDAIEIAAAQSEGAPPTELEGKAAPDFTLKTINGEDVTLSALKDSVVVLDFWATWCGPCREGMPHLDKIADELKATGVKVYAVNLEETKEDVQAFIKETNLKLPVLLDSSGDVGRLYRAQGIPETVIIDRNGIVKKVYVGLVEPGELKRAIEDAGK